MLLTHLLLIQLIIAFGKATGSRTSFGKFLWLGWNRSIAILIRRRNPTHMEVESGRRKLGKDRHKPAQCFLLLCWLEVYAELILYRQEGTSAGRATWHIELLGNISKEVNQTLKHFLSMPGRKASLYLLSLLPFFNTLSEKS